jgi:RNA polymerase sigma factor (sigma-70 family)
MEREYRKGAELTPEVVRQCSLSAARICCTVGAVNDIPDASQEALLAAWMVMDNFDPSRGSLTNFLREYVEGAVWDHLRRTRAIMRPGAVHRIQFVSFDDVGPVRDCGERLEPIELGYAPTCIEDLDAEATRRKVRQAIGALPKRWAFVIARWCAGASLSDIGKKIGVNGSRAGQIRNSGLRKIRLRLGVSEHGRRGEDGHLLGRLMSKVVREPNSGCLLWTGAITARGQGKIAISGSNVRLAHRISFELHNGPIPPGTPVKQTCGIRRCIEPEHLAIRVHPRSSAANHVR